MGPRSAPPGLTGLEDVEAQGGAEAVSPVVERVLGRPGARIEAFLARSRARF